MRGDVPGLTRLAGSREKDRKNIMSMSDPIAFLTRIRNAQMARCLK